MSRAADEGLERLRSIIRAMRSALVAYSGGVDSALVMAVAHEQLGERALACIGVSPSYPARERAAATALAEALGAAYRIIEPGEHRDERYAANSTDRCYFCKTALFAALRGIAQDEGWDAVLDGAHLDDVIDHAHGIRAASERGVRSPLVEARLTKRDVRELARAMNLPVWDKPAMACLASRVPHGTAITPALLRQIEAAEDALAELGFREFRVRHHGEVARIELGADELAGALNRRESIVAGIRAAGYRFVTIDLAGFRGGTVAAGGAGTAGGVPRPLESIVPLSISAAGGR
jgi:uncharacterized protein